MLPCCTAGHAECAANWKRYGAYVDMLLELSTAGYRMAHLPETYALARVSDWAAPLPLFEEVAHGNLLYDKRDARLLKVCWFSACFLQSSASCSACAVVRSYCATVTPWLAGCLAPCAAPGQTQQQSTPALLRLIACQPTAVHNHQPGLMLRRHKHCMALFTLPLTCQPLPP